MPQPNNSLNQFLAEFTAKTAYDTYSSEREQYQKTQQPGYKGPSYVDNLLLNRIPTELVQPENVAMEAGVATGGLGLAFLLKRFGPNALRSIKNMIGKPVSSADDLSRSQANLNRAQLQQPKDFDNLAPSYNDYINNLKTGKAPLRDYQNLDSGSQRLIFKDGRVVKEAQASNRLSSDYTDVNEVIDGDILFNRNRNQRSSGGMSQYDLDNQSLVSDQIDNTDMMSMNDFRRQFSRQQLDEAMNKNTIDVGQGNRMDIDELAEQLTDMDMYSEQQAIKNQPFDPESQFLNEGPSLDPNNAGYDPDMVRSDFFNYNKNELLKQKTSHGKAKTAVKSEKSFNEIVDDLKNIVSNYDETGKPLPLNKQTQGDRVKASADNILSEFEKIFGKKRAK